MSENPTRNSRRALVGVVTSDKMAKTVTVKVERAYRHSKYGKIVRQHKKYHAHDEQEIGRVGDRVEITATRPLSKLKRWRLSRVLVSTSDLGVETDATNPEAVRNAAVAAAAEQAGESQ